MKKIKLYFVTPYTGDTTNALNHIYTVVSDMRQARTYINKRVFLEHENHFRVWCDLHNRNPEDLNTFYDYIDIRYGNDSPYNDYDIIPVTYKVDDLCSVFRKLSSIKPLGLYYESNLEKEPTDKQTGVK